MGSNDTPSVKRKSLGIINSSVTTVFDWTNKSYCNTGTLIAIKGRKPRNIMEYAELYRYQSLNYVKFNQLRGCCLYLLNNENNFSPQMFLHYSNILF